MRLRIFRNPTDRCRPQPMRRHRAAVLNRTPTVNARPVTSCHIPPHSTVFRLRGGEAILCRISSISLFPIDRIPPSVGNFHCRPTSTSSQSPLLSIPDANDTGMRPPAGIEPTAAARRRNTRNNRHKGRLPRSGILRKGCCRSFFSSEETGRSSRQFPRTSILIAHVRRSR